MRQLFLSFIVIVILHFSSCVQKAHLKTIHCKLDMSGIENPSNVGIKGQFGAQHWSEIIYMTDQNSDGIFEGTFSLESAKNYFEFKFVHQNDQFELQNQENRKILFEYYPQTINYEAIFNSPEAKIAIFE